MSRLACSFLQICTAVLIVTQTVHAADPAAAEAKLRESLRNTMLQLRTMQGERDALQAAKTQLEQEKQALTQQVEKITKQMAGDKESADKTIAELRDQAVRQGDQILQLKDALENASAENKKVVALAQHKENERAKLTQEKIELERIVADQGTKNREMYNVGKEILGRYESFGLGTAITAREPFIGTMRVKLENLVQDLGDKLSAQRIKAEKAEKPAAEKPAVEEPAPAKAPPAKPAKPAKAGATRAA